MDTKESNLKVLLYVGPAVLLLFVLMVYPTLDTIRLSFMDRRAENFVGLENYEYVVSSARMQEAVRNNVLWLIVFTVGTVGLGLIIAVMADKVRYEALAKSVIFLPMAISFVGAGVIWKFVYDLNPPGSPLQPEQQIGLLNAAIVNLFPDQSIEDAISRLRSEGITVEPEPVANALVESETAAIQEAVTEETLTQEQAADLLDRLPGTAHRFLDGDFPAADQGWQTVGNWARLAVAELNRQLENLPEGRGSGAAICQVVPATCADAIIDAEEEALETAAEEGIITQGVAEQLEDRLEGAAAAFVQSGQTPSGEGWQTVSEWGEIVASTRQINVRGLNEALDTGAEPIDWLRDTRFNNIALIIVGVWIWTGFCMVVLSASLKNIPDELFEAARVDGANEFQIFGRITVPLLMPTLTVVTTTMIITVLKVFDIVYVMTAGNFGTEVIANRMYLEMYGGDRDFGHASAIAVILMLAIVPIMIFNVYQFRRQESQR